MPVSSTSPGITLNAPPALMLPTATTAFDTEIQDLIDAAEADLGIAGVEIQDTADPLIKRAVITYCRANFGQPDDYERLKRSYDEQKANLQMATGYTDWLGVDE